MLTCIVGGGVVNRWQFLPLCRLGLLYLYILVVSVLVVGELKVAVFFH